MQWIHTPYMKNVTHCCVINRVGADGNSGKELFKNTFARVLVFFWVENMWLEIFFNVRSYSFQEYSRINSLGIFFSSNINTIFRWKYLNKIAKNVNKKLVQIKHKFISFISFIKNFIKLLLRKFEKSYRQSG